jgi:hypothetical protein
MSKTSKEATPSHIAPYLGLEAAEITTIFENGEALPNNYPA